MKKIFLLPFIALFLALGSCDQDESLDPRPVMVPGNFVRLDLTEGHKRMNAGDLENTYFGGLLTSPSGKVVKYNLYVRKMDGLAYATDFKLIKTITSFPAELKVTPAEIAEALDVPLNSLVFADTFRFYAESFDDAGNRADYYSLSATIQGAVFMRQAYRFITDLTDQAGTEDANGLDNYPAQ